MAFVTLAASLVLVCHLEQVNLVHEHPITTAAVVHPI